MPPHKPEARLAMWITPSCCNVAPMMRPRVVGRRDVRHGSHRVDQRALECGLGSRAVAHEIEAVGNLVPLERAAVACRLGRTELAVVGVGGLVQIDVHVDPAALSGHAGHRERRLGGGAARFELPIRIQRVRVPAIDGLVAPWADARKHEQVERVRMAAELVLEPLQRALHAAGLVTVNAAGDQHHRSIGVPGAAAHGIERIAGQPQGRVVENAVLEQLGLRGKTSLERRHHFRCVASLRLLAHSPRVLLGCAPRRAGNADRVRCDRLRGAHDFRSIDVDVGRFAFFGVGVGVGVGDGFGLAPSPASNLVPTGEPQPVHASHPGPAV